MNLITDIAEMASKGWTAARMAVELEMKHGVQVSEAWLEHIMNADGFHAALAQARAKLASLVTEVETKVEEIVSLPDAEVKKVVTAEETEIAQAEGGESSSPAVVDTPAPAAPETKAADEPKSE